MKKSTLIKIISMALTALMVLSFASCFNFGNKNNSEDDANKVTLYLDPNGGELPEGTSDEMQVVIGEKIGKLPTPTRPGYTFLGWFEDGNDRYPIDRKTEAEDYDMDIVALWEAAGELAAVEFTLASGETFDDPNVKTLYDVVVGNRISTVLQTFPTASKEGFKFNGWQDSSTKQTVTASTKVEGDLVLVPKWERIVYCNDGTENHQWNAWQESAEATCTTPAQTTRQCSICGHTEYNITQEALGHSYGDYETTVSESGSVVRTRTCTECDDVDTDPLKNISFDSFNTPIVDGDCWGGDKGSSLIDGNFTDTNIAGKGTGAMTITLNAKEPVYVDMVVVAGQGRAAYTVTVTYSDGTEKALGIGAFGATKAFIVEQEITKIVVYMENPSNGSDYWSEVAALVINK